MTSLHTVSMASGQSLSATEDGPTLYQIEYHSDHDKPWLLSDERAGKAWDFRTLEGAQYFALSLEAERA